jgi:hypothetical protein
VTMTRGTAVGCPGRQALGCGMNSIRARRLLTVHAIAVAALTALYGLLAAVALGAPDAGPTSGVALLPAWLPLMLLGMPWSLVFCANPYAFDGLSEFGHHAVIVGPAWLNLAVHAVVSRVRAARSESPPQMPTDLP